MNNLSWKVVAICTAKNNGNYEDFTRVVATFHDPWLAQDFIDKCLPEENRDKFRVEMI